MTKGKSGKSVIERLQERRVRNAATQVSEPISSNEAHTPIVEEEIEVPKRFLKKSDSHEKSRRTRNFAELNLKKLKNAGFVTPDSDRTRIVEEMRSIKRPLLLNAFENSEDYQTRNHVILVTSANPGEGKTFVAINLAMSIASEKGLNVLLIDADVMKQDIPKQLGFSAKRGFLDLIVDDSLTIPDVLVRTNVPNLSILPSGQYGEQATELISSPHMKTLMSDIATRYSDRVIVIDTPPILLSSETAALAYYAGQVALVVETAGTSGSHVKQALNLLDCPEKIGFILNKWTGRHNEYYGAYGAYYRQ